MPYKLLTINYQLKLTDFQIAIKHLVPWQSLLVQLLHEWIWVELLYVPYAWLLPDALEEHHGTNHGWHTGGVAYALHTGFVVSLLVLAVVINVVGEIGRASCRERV